VFRLAPQTPIRHRNVQCGLQPPHRKSTCCLRKYNTNFRHMDRVGGVHARWRVSGSRRSHVGVRRVCAAISSFVAWIRTDLNWEARGGFAQSPAQTRGDPPHGTSNGTLLARESHRIVLALPERFSTTGPAICCNYLFANGPCRIRRRECFASFRVPSASPKTRQAPRSIAINRNIASPSTAWRRRVPRLLLQVSLASGLPFG